MIEVLIADDQALIRAGIRTIIEAETDMRVVAEASNGAAMVAAARRTTPDVVLLDVEMPGSDGLTGLKQLMAERPEARVVMLTIYDVDDYVFHALRAGASGFLLKSCSPAELTAAIRRVHEGTQVFAPAVTRRLVDSYTSRAPRSAGVPAELADLTGRELDVLRAIARGLSNREIGRALHLSEATVKTHVARVLSKLDVRDRVQAVICAHESGLDLDTTPD